MSLSGQVLGAGPLAQALVCVDLNDNNACEDGEPASARTGADGRYTLTYAPADSEAAQAAAAAPLLAVFAPAGPSSPDALHLKAPAGSTAVLSPLTTLVQRVVALTGATPAQAQANLRQQLALDQDLLAGYDTASRAGVMAATFAQISQQAWTMLGAQVGQPDSDGRPMTSADLAVETQNALINKLTSLRHMLGQSFARQACDTGSGQPDCTAVIAQAAQYWLTDANESGLTARSLPVAVGATRRMAHAAPEAPTPPEASGLLDWFYFGDGQNWYHRALLQTQAQATPVDGLTRFRDQRTRSTQGTISTWATGGTPERSTDLHWNGSQWMACPTDYQGVSTVRSTAGVSDSNYCDGRGLSRSRRLAVDISGRKVADLINEIKASPYSGNGPYGSRYSTWGPQGTAQQISTVLGDASFAPGAKLFYQNLIDLENAPSYDPRANTVAVFEAAVVAGGDARTNPTAPCWASNPSSQPASTLETVIERFPGRACSGPPGTLAGTSLGSGERNEAWGTSTLSIGTLGSAPLGTAQTATDYYTANVLVRVSFKGLDSNELTFWECRQRAINGSTRNCDAVGTGTYTIEQLGDARVMRLSSVPGLAAHLDYDRVLVERGGRIYYGYRGKATVRQVMRLNLGAANTLLELFAQKAGANALTPLQP